MTALLAPPDSPALAGRFWPDDYPPVNVRGITLRPVPQDVSVARRFARTYCDSRGISETVANDVCLCVSELVTNAFRHAWFPVGRGHVFVQLRQMGPFVSARVFDPDWEHLPVVDLPVHVGDENGRGLSLIVSRLACRLEFAPAPHLMKRVEFWVDCLPSAAR